MYMDGRGIHQRTRALTDALWAKVPQAVIGTSAAIAAPFIGGLMWIAPSREPSSVPWLGIGIAAVCVLAGTLVTVPYFQAEAALKRHTREMNAETEKRGEGWAAS